MPPNRDDYTALISSLQRAQDRHGQETLMAAFMAAMNEIHGRDNRELQRNLLASNDVGEGMVQWHLMRG